MLRLERRKIFARHTRLIRHVLFIHPLSWFYIFKSTKNKKNDRLHADRKRTNRIVPTTWYIILRCNLIEQEYLVRKICSLRNRNIERSSVSSVSKCWKKRQANVSISQKEKCKKRASMLWLRRGKRKVYVNCSCEDIPE
jgi:hypothetical protein